jgi:hypothetical protein
MTAIMLFIWTTSISIPRSTARPGRPGRGPNRRFAVASRGDSIRPVGAATIVISRRWANAGESGAALGCQVVGCAHPTAWSERLRRTCTEPGSRRGKLACSLVNSGSQHRRQLCYLALWLTSPPIYCRSQNDAMRQEPRLFPSAHARYAVASFRCWQERPNDSCRSRSERGRKEKTL